MRVAPGGLPKEDAISASADENQMSVVDASIQGRARSRQGPVNQDSPRETSKGQEVESTGMDGAGDGARDDEIGAAEPRGTSWSDYGEETRAEDLLAKGRSGLPRKRPQTRVAQGSREKRETGCRNCDFRGHGGNTARRIATSCS